MTAFLSAVATFDFVAKLAGNQNRLQRRYLLLASLTVGLGLWAVALLDSVPSSTSVGETWSVARLVVAWMPASLAAGVVLFLAGRRIMTMRRALAGSLIVGGLLAATQTLVLNALILPGRLVHSPGGAVAAIFFAVLVAFALMRLAFAMRDRAGDVGWARIGYAGTIGLAFYGMHALWISSLTFSPGHAAAHPGLSIVPVSYVGRIMAAIVVDLLLALTIAALAMERRVSRQSLERELSEERHRVTMALTEHRVSRLENEALVKEIEERKKIEAALNHAAFHDDLTGLNNRLYFMERLTSALQNVQSRTRTKFAVMYIDLDNFKSINDIMGHRYGDAVLQEVARRLQRCTREEDTLARMGGDEFTLLFFHFQNTEQAFRMAQRLINVIEEPLMLSGMRLPLSASVGLCEVGAEYTQAEDILRDADTAMYRAKREGGARCIVYNESMHEEALSHLQEKQQLKAAVEEGQFELYYQPLVNMRESTIYGVEALIRWNHPLRGLVGPGSFIQLAERTGHIIALGTWILRRACEDYQHLQVASPQDLVLSVNVSSRQLEQDNFLTELLRILEETRMNPRLLQLEITESIFLKDAARMGQLFKEIRDLGVKIAFDDFGTGYSSLSYLEKYPIDTLKIDQSFVQHMRKGSVNADIVQLTIKLAEAIGMEVSAEGVEEPKQAFELLEYGCRIAQGYLYGRPVQLDAMTALLSQGISMQSSGKIRTLYSRTS